MNRKEYLFDEEEIKLIEEGCEGVYDLMSGSEFDPNVIYRLLGWGVWITQWYEG